MVIQSSLLGGEGSEEFAPFHICPTTGQMFLASVHITVCACLYPHKHTYI